MERISWLLGKHRAKACDSIASYHITHTMHSQCLKGTEIWSRNLYYGQQIKTKIKELKDDYRSSSILTHQKQTWHHLLLKYIHVTKVSLRRWIRQAPRFVCIPFSFSSHLNSFKFLTENSKEALTIALFSNAKASGYIMISYMYGLLTDRMQQREVVYVTQYIFAVKVQYN